jgi:hypothetical protein
MLESPETLVLATRSASLSAYSMVTGTLPVLKCGLAPQTIELV